MEGMHELFERWNAAEQERFVVATLLAVRGHSYRKPGAVMLFGEDGPAAGSLSPGCLEADLSDHAARVLESGKPVTVTYDMDSPDDPLWGEASFCGGSVSVLLEPLEGDLKDAFLQLRYWIDLGGEVLFNRIFDSRGNVQAYRLIREGGTSKRFGSVNRSFRIWSVRYGPKPRLVVFGRGTDSRPVAELASRVGFRVTAADWRESVRPQDESVPYECITAPLSALMDAVNLRQGDRVLMMSHHYQQDRELLEKILKLPVRYIGLLGSKARAAKLLEGLVTGRDARIHAPVGLPIGAAGPEQIAVSIVGELIADNAQERREREGKLIRNEGAIRRNGGTRQTLRFCSG